MGRTQTALVIGGGIAGPVAAMALQKAGITATVHEAYAGDAAGVGGTLSIAPNGQYALGVIGADHVVTEHGTVIEAMVMSNGAGRVLGEFGGGDPLGLPPMRMVWRDDLNAGLAAEAAARGIRTVHGKRLVGAEESADGVTARFADGTTATADVLIGADGIRSVTRSLIDPGGPGPAYTGILGFGGRLSAAGLPSTRGRMHMVWGKKAFLGYLVEDDGTGGWFVNLPWPEPLSMAETRRTGNEEWLRRLHSAFAGDANVPAAAMIPRTDPAGLITVGALEYMPKVPAWHRGRMIIIGDAAHATSPSAGQGASLAIESAVTLARCLRDLPYADAFAAYEAERRERVERIVAIGAKTAGNKAAGPVARFVRDLTMPLAMRFLAKPERNLWQFGYRVEWDRPATAVTA